MKIIQKEFDESEYIELSERLQKEFSEIADSLNSALVGIFGEEIPADYDIFLTKYGVGGSYGLPNNVVFNIYNKNGLKTIVHLMIEENIRKYEIRHWEKEKIVDLILNSEKFIFLKYDKWQKGYNGAENYIDELFNKYFFESPEKFFAEIEKVREKHYR